MAYEKTVWQKGMVLTAENLNKIENALEGITSVVSVETDSSGVNTTGTTTGSLSVSGTSTLGVTNISGATTIGTQGTAADLTVNGNITSTNKISGKTLKVTDKIDVDGDSPLITTTGRIVAGNIFGSTLGIGINNEACTIDVDGNITSSGNITASNGMITGNQLTINATSSFNGNVTLNSSANLMVYDTAGTSGLTLISQNSNNKITILNSENLNHLKIDGQPWGNLIGEYQTIRLGTLNSNANSSSEITLYGNSISLNANNISLNANNISLNANNISFMQPLTLGSSSGINNLKILGNYSHVIGNATFNFINSSTDTSPIFDIKCNNNSLVNYTYNTTSETLTFYSEDFNIKSSKFKMTDPGGNRRDNKSYTEIEITPLDNDSCYMTWSIFPYYTSTTYGILYFKVNDPSPGRTYSQICMGKPYIGSTIVDSINMFAADTITLNSPNITLTDGTNTTTLSASELAQLKDLLNSNS